MNKKFTNFTSDETISRYFKDVRKSGLITRDYEIELAKKILNGDKEAIDILVKSNLKFVISIAKDYQGQGLPLSDLISEGNYGLIKAATKFDHTRGFRFISYAVWWIKQSIIQGLNDNARMVRLPISTLRKLSFLKKQIEKFETHNEREPVFGEILDSNNDIMEIIGYPKFSSLNDPINEDGDELIELIQMEEKIDNRDSDDKIKEEINKTLSILSKRELEIIENYFGMNTDCEPMTLEAIGDKYSLTKERIRQIKNKCIRKLRYNSDNLFNYINGENKLE